MTDVNVLAEERAAIQAESEPDMLAAALACAGRGWAIFPLRGKKPITDHGLKDASADPDKVRCQWTEHPTANIGYVPRENELAIDIDLGSGGYGTLAALVGRLGPLPQTVRSRTGGGGEHFFFRIPRGLRIPSGLGKGIDLKGGGKGYLVIPPSRHASGRGYEWMPACSPEERAFAELPLAWVEELKRPASDEGAGVEIVHQGGRDRFLASRAGSLRSCGFNQEEIFESLRVINERRCRPPLSERDVRRIAASISRYARGNDQAQPSIEICPTAARSILATDYSPQGWVVPGLLPYGLTLLAGRPKIGKSWLVLNLAVAVSAGGPFLGKHPSLKGDAVYFALEDSARRIKARLLGLGVVNPPEALLFEFKLARLDLGGLEALDEWLAKNTSVKLVIVDVLNRIKPPKKSGVDAYQHDTDSLVGLQALAVKRDVSIVVVHHDRKAAADDWVEQISGTLGLTGTADALMLLSRKRGSPNGRLQVTGRDLDSEPDLALEFVNGLWQVIGSGDWFEETPERQRIFAALRKGPMSAPEIAEATGMRPDSAKQLLLRLFEKGLISRPAHGRYALPEEPEL